MCGVLFSQELIQLKAVINYAEENVHCYNPKWSDDSQLLAFNLYSRDKKNISVIELNEIRRINEEIGRNECKHLCEWDNYYPCSHSVWRKKDEDNYILWYLFHKPIISANAINSFYEVSYRLSSSDIQPQLIRTNRIDDIKIFGPRFDKNNNTIYFFNNVPSNPGLNNAPRLYSAQRTQDIRRNNRISINCSEQFSFLEHDGQHRETTRNMQSYVLELHPNDSEKALITMHKNLDFLLYKIEGFYSDDMQFSRLNVSGPVIYDAIWINDDLIAYLASSSQQIRNNVSDDEIMQEGMTLKIYRISTGREISINGVTANMHRYWNPVLFNETPSIYYSKVKNKIFFIGTAESKYGLYAYNLANNTLHLISDKFSLPDYMNVSPDGQFAAIVAKSYNTDTDEYRSNPQFDRYWYKIFIYGLQ